MAYRIDTTKFDNEIATVVNNANTTIKNAITDFNTELNKLGNGETWIGGSAETNVGELVGFYNTYKDAYVQFVKGLSQDNAAIFDRVNGIISANRGTPLSVESIENLSLENPNIKDLSFAGGESGDATVMKSCAETFTELSDTIKNAYLSIKDAYDKIGVGSQILDLSDNNGDPATQLKNNVSDIISGLQTVDSDKFKKVIDNINIAAENIKRG